MGKKYRGKICVYCAQRRSNTDEHIFSRELFTIANRANLPKAPACSVCNGQKSRLEHYLTAVLPFGGRHLDAVTTLQNMVAPRLAKNAKLHRRLSTQRSDFWAMGSAGLWVRTTSLPFDGKTLVVYFDYVVRGLAWFHWGIYLDDQSFVFPMCVTQKGEMLIKRLLTLNAKERASNNLGNGTIQYIGAQGVDRPDISVWLFELYGGIVLAGDPSAPERTTTAIGALTGPKRAQLRSLQPPDNGGLTLDALLQSQ